ncbi:protein-L-isoaspartate(D-aspartate) O-methyltransferase [Petrocella sp. FN5]|uniref:protein-L-isoaspartate(D-aspartate) O-methyltransferase n=1 Tax=Petrocella sp. FN5 TaxID=3032002 RepID=UPI0023DAE340|nr:protein-L-isoaspartate(D-aspartate) O-methyltransferase [Petrocella sp. FN5]MDF1615861.1 protein-L-isoaspartate(D-aspartate) O-methyltransferase [Petrocella sp. FN5]
MNKSATKTFFKQLDRRFFMEQYKDLAHVDRAFPIGFGQTISQPSLVLYMTELLELKPEHKVLEIGTGSGYQTAFLAQFSKWVYTVETIEPLMKKAETRLKELNYHNIDFVLGDGTFGLKEHAPYDRIIVTAAAREIPPLLIDQLSPNGRLLIPVGNKDSQDLSLIRKDSAGNISVSFIEPVRFVPLVGDYEL